MKKIEIGKQNALQRLELRFKSLIKYDKDFLTISRDFIEKTLQDLYYLRAFHKELSSKEENYNSLQSDMQILQNRLQNQDSLIRTIDMSYMDKINDLKDEIFQLNGSKSLIESQYNSKILLLSQENERLQAELESLRSTLSLKNFEINELLSQKMLLEKRAIELEDIREYKPIDLHELKLKWMDIELDKQLQYILRSVLGNKILVFLKPKDVFNLSLLNKSIFQWFSFNGKQYLHALKVAERSWDLKYKDLKYKMGYFHRVSDKIPEEFLKSAILRYICQKEKLGDYMTPILHEAQKLAFLQQNEENDKLKNLKTPNKIPMKIEKTSNQTIENMNQIVFKLFPNMAYFIKGELFQNVAIESKEMVIRAFEKANEISANMLLKYPQFSEAFCKSFAKLLVFSALLLQDSKV